MAGEINSGDQAPDDRPAPEPELGSVEVALTWIDIPVGADEPVAVALLKHFLTQNRFEVTETRSHLSVRLSDIDRLVDCVRIWAFDPEHIPDPRNLDSLDSTLRSLGYRVLQAAEKHRARRLALSGDAFGDFDNANNEQANVLDLR